MPLLVVLSSFVDCLAEYYPRRVINLMASRSIRSPANARKCATPVTPPTVCGVISVSRNPTVTPLHANSVLQTLGPKFGTLLFLDLKTLAQFSGLNYGVGREGGGLTG